MTSQSELLKKSAIEHCAMLSQHEVLKNYWEDISLILKGSVARGNADQYSDIDFIFYASEKIRQLIVDEYYKIGLTTRTDGIFMPLPDWIGHYHIESFELLERYFEEKNYPQVWECTNIVVMHDPKGRYSDTVEKGLSKLFDDPLNEIKPKYLELQLTLDWLRHPLKRGDKIAVLLHCSKIVKIICELCFLLDKKAYPHDKWICQYLKETRLGKAHNNLLLDYAESILDKNEIITGSELDFYPQYTKAEVMIKCICSLITDDYGNQPWIAEWYLYV